MTEGERGGDDSSGRTVVSATTLVTFGGGVGVPVVLGTRPLAAARKKLRSMREGELFLSGPEWFLSAYTEFSADKSGEDSYSKIFLNYVT